MTQETSTKNIVSVTNRNNGRTTYILPNGTYREFNLGQTRQLDLDELKELRDCDGGEYLLKNFLIINDKTALDYLDLHTEPEYFYTKAEIEELLANGSLDQLEDCLNFAPEGVIELVKDVAIKTELSDTRKRKLIQEKTGFSIDNAIMVNTVLADSSDAEAAPKIAERKAQPIQVEEKPVRKYTVTK
jgi:hypothetical protein